MVLAAKEFALLRGDGLNSWQRLLFRYVPTSEGQKRIPTDIKNISNEPQMFNAKNCWLSPIWERIYFGALITKLGGLLFDVLERLVPPLKLIRDKKSKYYNALKLVECLCKKIESLSFVEVRRIVGAPLLAAAKNDNYELVEAVVRKFPSLIYVSDVETGKRIFDFAVEHRCENVFNLVHRMSQHRALFMDSLDLSGNTVLHLAAKLAPKNKLNLVPGAALQMQRELQWFKEVNKFVPLFDREHRNAENKTPSVVFTEEHAELKIKGEEWMKGTANSCTIAAALITTIAFAAAITVPGGDHGETGLPIFAKNGAFIVFAISNAASLFTSTTSLLVFLSILTSRYAEEDFLYALPRSLILGLLTLFLSITLMTVSFSAAVYIVLGQKKAYVLIPVAVMACLPIMSFVLLQSPLIVALISSTWRGIFGKKSNRPFY
ncbi:ankyrin repeat-containing protein NPR4-like [Lycium barbarum]|uniref:ankyrin repeat-containing protein NPR4-like n=1 Tax=Lycium barbarum TaxID=112863 RepID=UPI00293E8723|nr:ankyrin repeat-containing protein NPR4-like [Lycium barbarum]